MSSHSDREYMHSPSLYDQFLAKLSSKDDEKSPRFSCGNINDLFHGKSTSQGSSVHSDGSEDGAKRQEEAESIHTKTEETEEFLKKIYEPADKVHGFDYDKMSMKMLLLNDRRQDSIGINLVGIVGMLGVGKTTLARLICNEEEVKQRFAPRILITMHAAESMETVAEKMLEHLGVDKDTIDFISKAHKLPGLLYALHLQLKGKRYLILVDDVQDKGKYHADLISCLTQGHGFPKGCGGAVILTTRNEKAIMSVVKEQNLHHLLPLSDPNSCWSIYQSLAFVEDIASVDSSVKDDLKKKCGGLPLAARILGELKCRGKKQNDQGSKLAGNDQDEQVINEAPATSMDGSKEASTDGAKEAPKGDASQAPTASNEADKQTSD